MKQQEALDTYLPLINSTGKRYKKIVSIWARPAVVGEFIETFTKDGKETQNTAKEGDILVKNPGGEQYLIKTEQLNRRYISEGVEDGAWTKYRSIGECIGIVHQSDEFSFIASWGESMVVKPNDMIVTNDGKEIYRIARAEFEETYAPVIPNVYEEAMYRWF